jgi:hypothetical protein
VSRLTSDPNDPELTRGVDSEPVAQAPVYLVLSDEERAKGFVRPYRNVYYHTTCQTTTKMGQELAETYAARPTYYGATFCVKCSMHRPLDEFLWVDMNGSITTDKVGS